MGGGSLKKLPSFKYCTQNQPSLLCSGQYFWKRWCFIKCSTVVHCLEWCVWGGNTPKWCSVRNLSIFTT